MISMMLETQPDQRPTVQQILETDIIQAHIENSFLVRYPDHYELREIFEKVQKEKQEKRLMAPLKFDPIAKKMVSTFEQVSESEELIRLEITEENGAEEEFGDDAGGQRGGQKSQLENQRKDFERKFGNKKGRFRVKDETTNRNRRAEKERSREIKEKKRFEREKAKKQQSAYSKMFIKKKAQPGEAQLEAGMFLAGDELREYKAKMRQKMKKRVPRKPQKPMKPWVGVMEEEEEVLQKEKEREEQRRLEEERERSREKAAQAKKKVMRRPKKQVKKKEAAAQDKTDKAAEARPLEKAPSRPRPRRNFRKKKKKGIPLAKASHHPRADSSIASELSVESLNRDYSEQVLNEVWRGRRPGRCRSEKRFADVFRQARKPRRASENKIDWRGKVYKGILMIEIEKVFPKEKEREQFRNLNRLKTQLEVVEYLHTRKLCGRLHLRRNEAESKDRNGMLAENFHRQFFKTMKNMLKEDWAYEVEKLEIEKESFVKREMDRKLRKKRREEEEREREQKRQELLEKRREWQRQFEEAEEARAKEERQERGQGMDSLREMQFVNEQATDERDQKESSQEFEVEVEEMDNEFRGDDIDLNIENEVVTEGKKGAEEQQREEETEVVQVVEVRGGHSERQIEEEMANIERKGESEGEGDQSQTDGEEEKGHREVLPEESIQNEVLSEAEVEKEEGAEEGKESGEGQQEREENDKGEESDETEEKQEDGEEEVQEERTEAEELKREEEADNETENEKKTEEKEGEEDKEKVDKKEENEDKEKIEKADSDDLEEEQSEEAPADATEGEEEDNTKTDVPENEQNNLEDKEEDEEEREENDEKEKQESVHEESSQQIEEDLSEEDPPSNVNVFKEDSEESEKHSEMEDTGEHADLRRFDTGKFPNRGQQHEEPEEDMGLRDDSYEKKRLVPLDSGQSGNVQIRKKKFQKNYEEIIDYNSPTNQNMASRVDRLRRQRDRIKNVGEPVRTSNRERNRERPDSHSPDLAQDSEISQIYNSIKTLSQTRQQLIGGYLNQHNTHDTPRREQPPSNYNFNRTEGYSERGQREYPRRDQRYEDYNYSRGNNYQRETPQNLDNFNSFGNEQRANESRYSRNTLSKREEVLHQTENDYLINSKRRTSPNRSRTSHLRKKKSREELSSRVEQQKQILSLQYRKNVILDKVQKNISRVVLEDLMHEISDSFRRNGTFTLVDSKRIQRNLFGDFDYYQRKELPSLYKLIDVEVELLSKTGY